MITSRCRALVDKGAFARHRVFGTQRAIRAWLLVSTCAALLALGMCLLLPTHAMAACPSWYQFEHHDLYGFLNRWYSGCTYGLPFGNALGGCPDPCDKKCKLASRKPIRYGTGQLYIRDAVDMEVPMPGFTFRQERTYANTFMNSSFPGRHWNRPDVHGTNWMGSIQPMLYSCNTGGSRADLYLLASANWSDAYVYSQTIDQVDHYLSTVGDNTRIEVQSGVATLVFPNQDTWAFYWDDLTPELKGRIQSITTAYNNTLSFTYETYSTPTKYRLATITSGTGRSNPDPTNGYVVECGYDDFPFDTDVPCRLTSLELFRASQGGHESHPIMTVGYEYAHEDVPNRYRTGDLQRVTVNQQATGDPEGTLSIVRQTMYWYHTDDANKHQLSKRSSNPILNESPPVR